MTSPVDNKRLAELRTAAEVGIRMSGLQPHTVHVRPDELAALVEEVYIARAQERPHAAIACRQCGCTDTDCSSCIARTGAPCYWVERDLCSACAGAPRVPIAQSVARGAAVRHGVPGALAILLDERGGLAIGMAAVDHPIVNPLLALANLLYEAVQELNARTEGIGPPAPRPSDRAACIHCRQDVALVTDAAAIREHAMTCSESPVVRELQRLRAMADQAEVIARHWEAQNGINGAELDKLRDIVRGGA